MSIKDNKKNTSLCSDVYNDVTDFEVCRFFKNTNIWISWEWNIIFSSNIKIHSAEVKRYVMAKIVFWQRKALTYFCWMLPLCQNQLIDLQHNSMWWFQYDSNNGLKWVRKPMICHIATHFISVFNYPNPTYLWYVKRFYKCLYGLNKIFWDITKEIWEKYFYITFYFGWFFRNARVY